jgi:hypothetical protein
MFPAIVTAVVPAIVTAMFPAIVTAVVPVGVTVAATTVTMAAVTVTRRTVGGVHLVGGLQDQRFGQRGDRDGGNRHHSQHGCDGDARQRSPCTSLAMYISVHRNSSLEYMLFSRDQSSPSARKSFCLREFDHFTE